MKIVAHGGIGSSSEKEFSKKKEAIDNIMRSFIPSLKGSENAVDTAVSLITQLEDNPLFNAGTGSRLQADGKIRMVASIMDSENLKFAAILNVMDVKNPIKIARKLLDEESSVLTGDSPFVKGLGLPEYSPYTKERIDDHEKGIVTRTGTVGAVVMDDKGIICSANSTGGRGMEVPGRVSDSGFPAGNFVSENIGLTCTGYGENVRNVCIAPAITYLRDNGFELQKAIETVYSRLERFGTECGIIGIDRECGIFHHFNKGNMVFASWEE